MKLSSMMRFGVLLFPCLFGLPVANQSFADITSTTGNILFDVDSDNSGELLIDANGLGVSTTAPSSNLHVVGNVVVEVGNVGIGTSGSNSSLQIEGSLGMNVELVSANTTLSDNSVILVDSSSDHIDITLPEVSGQTGRLYHIKKLSASNNVHVGGHAIDESISFTLPSGGNSLGSLSLVAGSNQYYMLGHSEGLLVNEKILGGNLALWLDAADGDSVSLTNGNVTQILDKSGRGYHGIPATEVGEPSYQTGVQNGKAIMRFNGSEDYIPINTLATTGMFESGNAFTFFVVAKMDAANNFLALLSYNIFNNVSDYSYINMRDSGYTPNAQTYERDGANTGSLVVDQTDTSTNFAILRFGYDGTNQFLSTNGNNAVSTAASFDLFDYDRFTLGALVRTGSPNGNFFFDGDIGEVILFDRALNENERDAIEKYLSGKWGIALP